MGETLADTLGIVFAKGGRSITVLHKEIARTDVEIHINVPCKSYGGDIHIHLWRGTKKEMYIPYDEENRCFQDDIPEKVYKEIYKQIEKAKRMLEQMRKTGG